MKQYHRIFLAVVFLLLLVIAAPGRAGMVESAADSRHAAHTRSILLGAHRGGMHLWPQNTLVAFREASERWPDVLLELDVHMTMDGHVVVIHDDTVDRTTNGSGLVNRMTLAEIRALDAAWHFTLDGGKSYPWRGKGVQIPTLREALEAAPDHLFLIEMKDGHDIARATVEEIRKAGAEARCILAAMPPAFIEEAKELAPEIATCYDFLSAMVMITALREGDWERYEPIHDMLALSTTLKHRFDLTPEEIADIREKGILVLFFTINDTEEMLRLLEIGVDAILTDAPDKLAEIIEAE